MQTSDPDIYAGGDCVSLTNIITGKPMYIPAGPWPTAWARVIATNVCGGQATFPGAVGSFCIKLFGLSLARTGLNQAQAEELGLEVRGPPGGAGRPGPLPPGQQADVFEAGGGAGNQAGAGPHRLGRKRRRGGGPGKRRGRADLAKGALLEDISNLELAYSPPLGAAVDVLNAAANTCENMLAGKLRPMSPEEFSRRLAQRAIGGNTVILGHAGH